MKKRVLAVLLSLTMCMATVVEAGAAMFDSSVSEAAAVGTTVDGDVNSEFTGGPVVLDETGEAENETTEAAEETVQDGETALFTSGEAQVVTEPENQIPADVIPVPDGSTGEAGTAEAVVAGVAVTKDDWVETAGKFMLKKPQTPSANETEPIQEMPPAEEPAGDTEAEITVPEEIPAEPEQQAVTEEQTAEEMQEIVPEAESAAEPEVPAVPEDETAADPQETPDGDTASDPQVTPGETAEPDVQVTPAGDTALDNQEGLAVDKSKYYTAEDGIISVNTTYNGKVYNGSYLFDENGMMLTGIITVKVGTIGYLLDTDQQLYFADSMIAVLNQGCEKEKVAPWTSNLGKMQKDTWVWNGTAFSFYDNAGKVVSVETLNDTAKAEGTYTGYFKINGDYYCLKSDGTPRVGNFKITINGTSATYYFQTAAESSSTIPGKMFYNGWRTFTGSKGERWIYYNKGTTTPADIGKALERGIIATKLDTSIKGNGTYLIDKYGYLIKSTMKKAENGSYYCTDKNGVIYKSKLVKYNGVRYYFGEDGKRVTWKNCWHTCPGAGSHMYYFGSTPGKVVEKTGWQKVTTAAGKFYGWFYFNTSGNNYMDKLTSTGYYFNAKGKLASGIVTIGTKKYFFEVSDENTHRGKMLKSALVYHKSRWYYASSTGVLRKSGWQKVNNSWYYFENYRAVTKKFVKKGSSYGYLNTQGQFCTGWVIISNSQNLVRYINPDAPGFLKSTNRVIDGLRYYFDANGYRINDLTGMYGGPYYVTVDRVNGTATVYNSDRTVPVKTIRVSVGLPGTNTPLGSYTLARSARWQALMGPSWGQYGTHVVDAGQGGIFVHSVSGSYANSYSLPAGEYNKLGNPASHGCIRMCVADAKWIYDNCNGAGITIFDGTYKANEAMKGPLGRRALVSLRSPYNFDPTDPNI